MDLLWTDFLNSLWHDWRGGGQTEDRLDEAEWLSDFLREWHLKAAVPPSTEEMAVLKNFRDLLQRMAENVVAGHGFQTKDIEAVNKVLAEGPVVRQAVQTEDKVELNLVPVQKGWNHVMAEISASFIVTLIQGETNRIRRCENPDCLWFFYDNTRNRSKRYCEDKTCGNLMKVRKFRERQRRKNNKGS